jgi:hypothetical protein
MKTPFTIVLFLLALTLQAQPNVHGNPNLFMEAQALSELTSDKLDEVSGIAASVKNSGCLWVQNDSGNTPQIFLINKETRILMTCTLKGVMNRDWEDLTIGPGPEPGKHYLYVADIGDNLGMFPTKFIYRFEEPSFDSTKKALEIRDFQRITFRLPDNQAKDSETLLIDPKTTALYILSKEDTARLYKIENRAVISRTDTLMAENVGSFPLHKIVAGSISPRGDEVLLKNTRRVFYWKNSDHKPLEEVLREKHSLIPYYVEPQGEAMTWAHDASGFYTLSEQKKNKPTFLYFYKRK